MPTVKGNVSPEDEVSRKADELVRGAGEAIIDATEGIKEPTIGEDGLSQSTDTVKRGKSVSVDVNDWGSSFGGTRQRVEVSRRPSLFHRLFRRGAKDDSSSHRIETDTDGRVVHRTVRPSVLGGTVEKSATTFTGDSGNKVVGYKVTRYDADGHAVERKPRDGSRTRSEYAHQTRSEEYDMENGIDAEIDRMKDVSPQYRNERREMERERRERNADEEEVVLNTATVIADRVQKAFRGDARDIESQRGRRRIRKVPQVPKGASKYEEGYQARRRAEKEAADNDPNSLEYAFKHIDKS